MEEAEITVLGEKGQIVIPKEIRDELKLEPKTKFLVIGYKDTIMLKKLETPDLKREWKLIKKIVEERNKRYGVLTEEDIKREVEAARRK